MKRHIWTAPKFPRLNDRKWVHISNKEKFKSRKDYFKYKIKGKALFQNGFLVIEEKLELVKNDEERTRICSEYNKRNEEEFREKVIFVLIGAVAISALSSGFTLYRKYRP